MGNRGIVRIAAVLAALWAVLAPAYSFAADDSQPTAHPQAADDSQVAHRPGLVKRAVRSFLSDDEAGGGPGLHLGPFVPRVEILSSGSGLAPMLHFWAPDIGGTPLDVHASAAYSMYGYQYYDLQVGLVPHVGKHLPRVAWGTSAPFPLSDLEKTAVVPGFDIYASARYRDYPREDFYGIGATSSRLDRTDYGMQDGLYEGIVRFRVARLSFMFRAGLLQTSIGPGTDSAFLDTGISNDERTAPGLLRAPDFVHFSGGAWLELRDEPGNPHGGASLGVAFSRLDDRLGNAFQFNRTIVDAREYISLGSHRHVVALRQVTSLEEPDAGSRVPFYLLSALGRSSFLRGYDSSRFRDEKLLALAGEYRFELVPKVELALIYETGKVFPTMSEFDLHNLLHSWGVGVRLKSLREVRLRLDVMHSAEGTRVDVKFGPSF
jgi:hypothetical protein